MDAITGVVLRSYPGYQLGDTLAERVLGFPLQQLPCFADICKAMTDVTPPIFAYDLRGNIFAQLARQELGNFVHGQRFTRADIDRLTSRRLFGSRNDSASHVTHVHKVALLLTVFK